MKTYKIAVVGATGMVGRKFLQVLEERKLPASEYVLFASKRSAGSEVDFMGKKYTVQELTHESAANSGADIALFSAGAGTSLEYAPIFAKAKCLVIDNSSAWRRDPNVPLVVPECNAGEIAKHNYIIANPNCSTIQAVVALKPIHEKYGIKRIVYSTYQAVSGAGMGGYSDLKDGAQGASLKKFPYPIRANVLPHIDVFLPNGYTKEEDKMMYETRRILGDWDIRITATTVRVPVFYGHSESINVETVRPCPPDEVKALLAASEGVVVLDDPEKLLYPMPIEAEDKDEVFVGRIRKDESVENGLNLWVVADNIRKGAATNAVQIAERAIALDVVKK